TRATMTAAPLARLTGLTVISDKDLRERYGGLWEGLTDTEIRVQYLVEHSQWRPPEGEASAAVADRACAAMERIADALIPGTLAVVVSHGAALRLGAARLLGLPEELWGVIGPLANCAWSVLGRRRGRWRLIEHNAGTLPEPVLSDDRLRHQILYTSVALSADQTRQPRGYSSVGRALAWHARSQGFESP